MHYIDEGSGETILMSHGNPTWSFYYRRLITHFSNQYRVVVPDHIGYGYSDKPKKYDYTVARQAKNLEEFIEKLGLKDITFVGHDWGGAWGMAYAVRHPENIKRLIFLNTFAFLPPEEALENKPWQLMIVRVPIVGAVIVRGLNGFSRFAILMCIKIKERRKKELKKGLIAPYDSWKNRVAVHKAVLDIPLSEDAPAYSELEYIENNLHKLKDTPKIFFWGVKDFVFTEVVLEKWLEFYPDAPVNRYSDAGHYVLEDAYMRIIPGIEKFLNENPI